MGLFKTGITMVISTPTIKDYINVVEQLISQGMRWCTNKSSVNSRFWETYGPNTHVIVRCGKILSYCGITYVNDYHLEVTEAYKFLQINFYDYFKEKYDLK